jgi:Na+-transporting NADH:ubiquinone oxidoreductase subunit NqrC
MPTPVIILLVILVVMIILTTILYFLGKKAEAKQAEQQQQIQAMAQQVSMLIVDKKKLKLKDAGLPVSVVNNTPWYAKRSKLPIVKAKIGPRMMNLICDANIFDDIPVKKEVKATVSGLYITSVRGLHGKSESTGKKKKVSLRQRLLNKTSELRAERDSLKK